MKKTLILAFLMLTSLVGTVCAEYGIKSRLSLSEIKQGDLVVFEAASTVNHYGYYIKETSGSVAWKQTLDDNCVWKIYEAEGGMNYGNGRKFYLQNVATNQYLSGNRDNPTTVADIDAATPIVLYPANRPWVWNDYDYQDINPRGWDALSVAFNGEVSGAGDSWFANDPGSKDSGKFPNGGGTHNLAWNIFAVASTDEGGVTPFDEINNGTPKEGIKIDNITYTLYTNTPSGYAHIAEGLNQNLDIDELFIPATVNYEGRSYRVTKFAGTGTFQGGTFTKLEFESPTNLRVFGDWDFASCNNVKEVVIPEGITTLVQYRAFSKMASLEKVEIPSTMTNIGSHSFSDNPNLTTVIFKGENKPTIGSWAPFGGETKPAQITVVVPNEAAIAKYIEAFDATDNKAADFNAIITFAQYEELLLGENLSALKKAAEVGVGRVNGIKDAESMSAVQDLLAGSPSKEDLQYAVENYILKLENGYYRVMYPQSATDASNDYLSFGSDKMLYAACDESDLTDYSTVFKVEILSDNEIRSDGSGYKLTLSSQDLRPTDTGYSTHQMMDEAAEQFVYATSPENTNFFLGLANAEGIYTDTRYIYKKPANEDKKIYSVGSQAPSAVCYFVPAKEIAIALHRSGENYWATINVPFGITLPEGTEAYVGKVEGNKFMLTNIGQEVPAGLPVILCGDNAKITAQITDNAQSGNYDNDLEGVYLANVDATDDILTLGEYDGKVGLYKSAFALGANKAYLPASVVANANGFKFVFADDDITGVSGNEVNGNDDDAVVYDLYGRKVTNPVKGNLYIKNGKVIKQ